MDRCQRRGTGRRTAWRHRGRSLAGNISLRIISLRIISLRIISLRIISLRIISLRIISLREIIVRGEHLTARRESDTLP